MSESSERSEELDVDQVEDCCNLDPEEIEAVILEVTKAENCKVFERDEKICAAIYTNIEADAKALLTVINENLPKYCHLAECEIVRNHLDRKWK